MDTQSTHSETSESFEENGVIHICNLVSLDDIKNLQKETNL
jgi:hypothetical protein